MSETRRRAIDPIATGLADAGVSGFRALETVADGLAELVSLRTSRGATRAARRAGPTAGTLAEDLLHIVAELLDRAGEVTHAVADALAERDGGEPPPKEPTPTPAQLVLTAPPGEQATAQFTYWNTGTAALTDVRFDCTDLVSRGGRIPNGEVRFDPPSVWRVAPGEGVTVRLTVEGDRERMAADYHGVVTGEPGASAILLTVRSTTATTVAR